MASIWKDYYVTLGEDDGMDYRVMMDETVIFTGKSYIRPGASENIIRINDICADYMQNVLTMLTDEDFADLTFPLSFTTQILDDGAWEDVDTVEFINDWSYDDSYDPSTMGMAFPINGHIDAHQLIPFTSPATGYVSVTIHYKDGTTETESVPIVPTDLHNDFSKAIRAAGAGTALFDVSDYTNVDYVTIGNNNYQVVTECGDYALYYMNAYGGWDTLLIEGNTSIRNELQRYHMQTEYDNTDVRNRARRNYINEVSKIYTLHTGLLSDAEASRMFHLLNATEVYLYDITTGEMIPVTINDTTTEYKTRKTDGAVSYAIEVTVAHDYIRR